MARDFPFVNRVEEITRLTAEDHLWAVIQAVGNDVVTAPTQESESDSDEEGCVGIVTFRPHRQSGRHRSSHMFRRLLKLLFAPFALIGLVFRWAIGASTPAPIRQADARYAAAQARSRLLDEAERAESVPQPRLLPPAAALAQARHLLIQTPAPDLSYVLPDIQEWIRGITSDEALKISVMPRDWLDDHVHGRRCAPGLRPVSSDAAAALERERRQDEIEDDAYLDELLRCMAPRC